MCSMSVLCPLCAQTSFTSIDALRCSLIKAANGPLACPICHELFLGLDKLTIHLFSHTNIMNANDSNASGSGSPTNNNNKQNTSNHNNKNNNSSIINISNGNNNNNNNTNHNDKPKTNENVRKTSQENPQPLAEHEKHADNLPATEVSLAATHHAQRTFLPHLLGTPADPVAPSPLAKSKKAKRKAQQGQDPSMANVIPQVPESKDSPLAVCDICEFTFRNEELRDMHVRLVHQNFMLSGAEQDARVPQNAHSAPAHSETDFKCHLCSKTFKMKGSLRVHLKVVHLMGLPYVNNAPKLGICERIRHKESKQQKALQDSAAIVASSSSNSNNLYNLQPIALLPSLPSAAAALGNISVVNIASSSDFLPALDPNPLLLVFNNSPQNPDNAIMPTPPAKERELSSPSLPNAAVGGNASDNPKIWECDVCSKAFTTKYFLKKHKRLHTGEMPYTCELCARTFTFQQSYHKHLLYHSDEKPHVCATCGRAFKELSTLHNHERIHSGEKPFKCEVCGKSFRQRVSFLVHTRIHTGVMPYKCEICQKSFRYKVSQRTHKCQLSTAEDSSKPSAEVGSNMEDISENFIKTLLEANAASPHAHLQQSTPQNSPASQEIAAINEKDLTAVSASVAADSPPPSTLNEQQQNYLSKAIDEIVVESCNKLGIGGEAKTRYSPVANVDEGSMSPSQKLQNMRLYSPQLQTPDLNGIDGDLTRFFLDNPGGDHNVL